MLLNQIGRPIIIRARLARMNDAFSAALCDVRGAGGVVAGEPLCEGESVLGGVGQ